MHSLLISAVIVALMAAAGISFARQNYPDRPIRLVVPFQSGGSYDPVARVVAHYIGESMKQQIVTDNRGGASGRLGGEIIARGNPDGYTVGILGNNHTITAARKTNMPFDVLKDFVPLMRVSVVDTPEVVKRLASQGVTAYSETPQEFLAFMKADIEMNRKIAKAANIKAE